MLVIARAVQSLGAALASPNALALITTTFATSPSDEVFYAGSIGRPGTNQRFHAVDERIAGHKPASLSFVEAAALPLTSITAGETLFDRFRLTQASKGCCPVSR